MLHSFLFQKEDNRLGAHPTYLTSQPVKRLLLLISIFTFSLVPTVQAEGTGNAIEPYTPPEIGWTVPKFVLADEIKPLQASMNSELSYAPQPVQNPFIMPQNAPRSNYPGNGYVEGNCTWYVKSQRPDLPNDLGNADMWAMNARSRGYTVSQVPSAGAVGVAVNYMHVVIVTSMQENTVTINEMNYEGLYIVSSRVAPTSEFVYIL